MKIAVVTREFSPLTRNGGIGTAMRCLCEHLAFSGGHEVTVYYTGRPHLNMPRFAWRLRRRGIRFRPVVSVPGLLLRDPERRSRKAFSVLSGARHDLCLFHEFMADGVFCLRARRQGRFDAPCVMVTHGSSLWADEGNGCVAAAGTRRHLYQLERECCELADCLISPSRYLIDWMRGRGWKLPDDARCIPNFTALPGSAPSLPAAAGDEAVELVFFGRLEERKGVRVFCKALDLLPPELLAGRRVTFLGKEAGYRTGDVRALLARQADAGARIAFLTDLDTREARRYLRAGRKLAVMPSLRENSPCGVAECLESGIPFLASSVGGGSELTREEDRNEAFFFPDPAVLAEKLSRALREGMPRAARPAYTPETLFARWQDLLRERATACAAGSRQEQRQGKTMTDSPATRRLVDKLYARYVSATDRALLDFVFSAAPTQEALNRCLAACDIEALGANKVLLLTYVAHEHPDLRFSAYAGPRIKGLNTYFRFANMKTLSHFSRIGKAYNAAGIPMLLFKGGAMKALRPDLSRPMGDVDVLIPAERMAEATAIGEALGYQHCREESQHAVDFHTETESAVDVHHALFDAAPGRDCATLHTKLVERAAPRHAFGVEFLLPCHEDLCFLVMNNLTKNLREHTSLHGLYFSLCDCRWLQRDKADFNWRIVREDAEHCGREMETRFAADFMNRVVPGIIPDPDRHLPGREAETFCNQVVYDEDYFLPRRRRCQALRVVELKNAPRRWGIYLLKYLIMERLRDNPAFVRWFLRRKERLEAACAH